MIRNKRIVAEVKTTAINLHRSATLEFSGSRRITLVRKGPGAYQLDMKLRTCISISHPFMNESHVHGAQTSFRP
jgi:hypothetical protein